MTTLVLNTQLLKKRISNPSKAARRAGIRAATIFDLYSGKTRIEHAEVRTLKALADLAGCTMDELVISEPVQQETFAETLQRWAAMPAGSITQAGPPAETAANEDEDVALLKRLPLSRDNGPASPKPIGKYAI